MGIDVAEHKAGEQVVVTVRPAQRLSILDRLPEAAADESRLRACDFRAAPMFDVLVREKLMTQDAPATKAAPLWVPRVYRVLDTIADFDPASVQRIEARFDSGSDARPFTTYLPLPTGPVEQQALDVQQVRKRIVALYVLAVAYNHGVVLGARRVSFGCGSVSDAQRPFAFTAQDLQTLLSDLADHHGFQEYTRYLQTFNFDPFVLRAEEAIEQDVRFGPDDMGFGSFLGIDIGGTDIKACLFLGNQGLTADSLKTMPGGREQMLVDEFFGPADRPSGGPVQDSPLLGIAGRNRHLLARRGSGSPIGGHVAHAGEASISRLCRGTRQECVAGGRFARPICSRSSCSNSVVVGTRCPPLSAAILENDGNAEAYGNYCMLARAGVIKPGRMLIVKLGTSLAGGDVNELGAVSPHVTEFSKAILDLRACNTHVSGEKPPRGCAREFISSAGVRQLSREFVFHGGEPLFGVLGGLNDEEDSEHRIESVELGRLLDLWALVDAQPLESNACLQELIDTENEGGGCCGELYGGRSRGSVRVRSSSTR